MKGPWIRTAIGTWLALTVLGPRCAQGQLPTAPLAAGEIVITEFFEDLYRVNPATGGKSLLPPGSFNPLEMIEIDRDRNVIAIDSTNQLVRFQIATQTVTPLTTARQFPAAKDLAIEPSGKVLVISESDIVRVDPATGFVTTLVDHTSVNGGFFGPNGIAVGPTGRIFVTEFFESAWEINAVTGHAAKLPLPRDVPHGSTIKVRSDGDLIVREANASLLRITPATGAMSYFWYGLPGFPKDFALEADDDVILTSTLGLFHYDADTGQQRPLTIVEPGEFFSPEAIAIAPGVAAPNPPADFNGDGAVDGMDLDRWRIGNGMTSGVTRSWGDADADQDADGADFLAWQRALAAGTGAPATTAVPEPASAMILAVVAAARRWPAGARRRGRLRGVTA